MDISQFLEQLKQLIYEIEEKAALIEKDLDAGIQVMPEVTALIQKVLPDWFFFIEQTEIGDTQTILSMVTDLTRAMQDRDEVLLVDTLLYGLRDYLAEYVNVIEEVLNEE